MATDLLLPFSMLTGSVVFALTPAVAALGRRFGHVDEPGERRLHRAPTPRTGGFAIVTGLLVSMVFFVSELTPVIACIGGVVALAALDDVKALDRRLRLVGQSSIAIAFVVWSGLAARELQGGGAQSYSGALRALLSVMWLIAMTNAYNFMDGINGIASIQAIVAGAALTILFARVGDEAGMIASLTCAAAAIGFLPWNFPRASVFMGDVGSTTLGFVFGALVLRALFDGIPLAVAALPFMTLLLDTGGTIALRISRGEAFFSTPHRIHFYQRLVAAGWSHAAVALIWGALAFGCSLVATLYLSMSGEQILVSVFLLMVVHLGVAVAISLRSPLPPSYRVVSD